MSNDFLLGSINTLGLFGFLSFIVELITIISTGSESLALTGNKTYCCDVDESHHRLIQVHSKLLLQSTNVLQKDIDNIWS